MYSATENEESSTKNKLSKIDIHMFQNLFDNSSTKILERKDYRLRVGESLTLKSFRIDIVKNVKKK